ncbi:hypothetical protein [Rhizobium grahamii]|uniref:Uncharacterized protein n=2 Tax=Rhizobium grahamii TaxID=1120045 RepID=S3HMK6_9HYPH|nr:hypothetical protein [Rhizobium grahamii]EPE94621.1 hypothetical protein RGCCGE502_28973 [Rhizobium grahamii CCGE 502]RDJ06134.1 hypothetical protein B5K06_23420 [Rhizobium grahamii]
MLVASLVPGSFYWARPLAGNDEFTIVQVSTVFGEDRDFWTLAVIGSDQHHMLSDFEIIGPVDEPGWEPLRQAAE